jgi:glycosyltransferase involved in cell wall biosynthesis
MTGNGAPRVRVCFFNRSYWPETAATGQLLTELCEDLAAHHGFEVTVVTGYPVSRPTMAPGVDRRPLPRREVRNGVTVIRAAGTTWPTVRFAGRAANYLSYFLSATAAALGLPRQDVTVALTDPPIVGLAALAARPRAGFVFLCQDVFPEVAGLLRDFNSPIVDVVLDRVSRLLVARAARIVALGDTMAARLVDGKGAPPDRITIIHNWADTTAIVPADKRNPFALAHGLQDRLVVLHAGNIGHGQNLEVVLDAADRLRGRPEILVLFIGDGSRREALEREARSRRLGNVRFLPFQPRDQLRWTYASSDLCLVSLKPGLAGYIVPSKLYPILAAGRPYVAAVDAASEVAAITERHACGLMARPGDPDALAARIAELADDPAARQRMGERARAAAALFDRSRQVAAHAAVLTQVAALAS